MKKVTSAISINFYKETGILQRFTKKKLLISECLLSFLSTINFFSLEFHVSRRLLDYRTLSEIAGENFLLRMCNRQKALTLLLHFQDAF